MEKQMFAFNISDLERLSEEYKNHYNFLINRVSTLNSISDHSLFFVNRFMDTSLWQRICERRNCLMILKKEDNDFDYNSLEKGNMVILSEYPRLDFAKIFQFVLENDSKQTTENPAKFGQNCLCGEYVVIKNDTIIGDNVRIDDRVSVGKDVHIGNHCHIMSGAVINDHVTIGNHCIIRENCVIGGWGFGFQRDENDIPIRLPHIGGVVIGSHVEVGALATIASGTFSPTKIGDYTKIDDHAHIAHNCSVGEKCYVMGGAILCGSVTVGDRCHIAPQAVIIDGGVVIGNDCTVGMGSVVKKSLSDAATVSGNPAKLLLELAKDRWLYNFLNKKFRDENPFLGDGKMK